MIFTDDALAEIARLVRRAAVDFAVDNDLEVSANKAGEIRVQAPTGTRYPETKTIVIRVTVED